jgi:hypothetical protein
MIKSKDKVTSDFKIELILAVEGKIPFSHILTDMGVVLTISESAEVRGQESPYQIRPHDKGGNPMPDELWNLVPRCLRYEPSERLDAHMMAGKISRIEWYRGQPVAGTSVALGSASSIYTTSKPSPAQPVAEVSTASSSHATASQMATQAIQFDEDDGTVLFGPVEDQNPEALFSTLF